MLFIHHTSLKRKVIHVLALLMLLFSIGCFQEFYRVNRSSLTDFKATVNTGKVQRSNYVVLHHRGEAMHFANIFSQNGKLNGTLTQLPESRDRNPRTYFKPVRYQPEEIYILEEIHLFTNDDTTFALTSGAFSLPDSAITEIHVYDKDKGATAASHIVGFAGLAATGFVIVELANYEPITFNRSSSEGSCPYVYANDGHTFRLQGEVFAGAIFPQLERHDYLPLPNIRPIDGGYQLRITNEQQEYHYINLAKLIVVEHPENSEVLLDKNGQPHTLLAPQLARKAEAPNGKDLRPVVAEKDFNVYFYEEGDLLQNHVALTFDKPTHATDGKLVLNAKSSHWSTMMFGSITEMLGTGYPKWVAQMSELPTPNMHQMMDAQGLRLGIYLWSDGQWKLVDRVENVGPVAFRDLIVPIDLTEHQDEEVRVVIEGGHLFWELDYAAMDFTKDQHLNYRELAPQYAISSDEEEPTKALSKDDDQYFELPANGHQVSIWYPAVPSRNGYTNSVFLHAKGHYEHIRNYTNEPDMANFPNLEQPGTFIQYSRDRFEAYLKTQSLQY